MKPKDFEEALKNLQSNYRNPLNPIAFAGVDNIYRHYNGILSKPLIRKFLESTEIYSMMKQEKKKPKNTWTPIVSFHYLDLVQIDLIDISLLSEHNSKVNHILSVIDCFSR